MIIKSKPKKNELVAIAFEFKKEQYSPLSMCEEALNGK